MDVIKDMLRDSLRHDMESLELYQKRIDSIPKGVVSSKKINGKSYYYLSYREGNKVKTDYLGKLTEQEVKEYQEKIEKRKRYQKMLKKLQKEIKFLRKVLGIKDELK